MAACIAILYSGCSFHHRPEIMKPPGLRQDAGANASGIYGYPYAAAPLYPGDPFHRIKSLTRRSKRKDKDVQSLYSQTPYQMPYGAYPMVPVMPVSAGYQMGAQPVGGMWVQAASDCGCETTQSTAGMANVIAPGFGYQSDDCGCDTMLSDSCDACGSGVSAASYTPVPMTQPLVFPMQQAAATPEPMIQNPTFYAPPAQAPHVVAPQPHHHLAPNSPSCAVPQPADCAVPVDSSCVAPMQPQEADCALPGEVWTYQSTATTPHVDVHFANGQTLTPMPVPDVPPAQEFHPSSQPDGTRPAYEREIPSAVPSEEDTAPLPPDIEQMGYLIPENAVPANPLPPVRIVPQQGQRIESRQVISIPTAE